MPIFNKCAPDGIDDLIKVGDEFMNKPHIKKMFTKSGADTIVSDKFFEIFRRPIEEWRDLKISKTKIKLFADELQMVANHVKKGKIKGLKEKIMVTKAVARRHPTLRKTLDDFNNINAFSKGTAQTSENSFNRMMKLVGMEAVNNGIYSQQSNLGWSSAKRQAVKLEKKIQDVADKIRFGEAEYKDLKPFTKAQTEFLIQGEGKVMFDFARAIETTLPALKDKILYTKTADGKTWLSEQKIAASRVGYKVSDALKSKIKDLLRTEGKLDGKPLSPYMREALVEQMDLTSRMYSTAEKGVDAIIKSYEYGMTAKGYDVKNPKWLETKKSLKKELLPKEMIGYFPHYGYEQDMKFMDSMMPRLDEMMIRTRESLEKNTFSIDQAIDGIKSTLSGRLKQRKVNLDPQDPGAYSRNVPVVMKRMIDDINQFNKNAFITRDTRKALLEMKQMFRQGKDLSGYGQSLMKSLMTMHSDQTGLKEAMHPELEAIRRSVLNLEFVSKLGFNIRSGGKQFNQLLAHKIHFGMGADRSTNKLFRDNPKLKDAVELMAKESGIYYTDLTPELQEITQSKIGKTKVVEVSPGKYNLEHHQPGKLSSFSEMTGWGAGKAGVIMRWTENWLRNRTFKTGFAAMYDQLVTSKAFETSYMQKFEQSYGRKPTDKEIRNEIYRQSREYAIWSVGEIHFNYDKVNKSDLLKSGPGSLAFQFQHFSHSFWDWNVRKFKGFKASAKTLEFASPEAKQFYGIGVVWGMAPVVAAWATGLDFGRLIENDSWEKIKQIGTLITGTDEEKKEMFAGRGALSTVISAPVMTDMFALAELYGLFELDEDSAMRYVMAYKGYHDETGVDEWGELARIISSQFGRTYNHTGQMFVKSGPGTWMQHELGLYPTTEKKEFRIETNKKIGELSPALEKSLNEIMGISQFDRRRSRKPLNKIQGYYSSPSNSRKRKKRPGVRERAY